MRRVERKGSFLVWELLGQRVPPRRNAALLSANYPAATNFPPLPSLLLPVPSPSTISFLSSPPPDLFVKRARAPPRVKNTRLGRERGRERHFRDPNKLEFLLSEKSFSREPLDEIPSFLSLFINRPILDFSFLFLSFSFLSFTSTRNYTLSPAHNENGDNAKYRCYHVAIIVSSIVQPCQLCLRESVGWRKRWSFVENMENSLGLSAS